MVHYLGNIVLIQNSTNSKNIIISVINLFICNIFDIIKTNIKIVLPPLCNS